jgi:sugar lactone lactonase YvrE
LRNVEALDMCEDGTILAVDQYANRVFSVSFDSRAMSLTSQTTVLDADDGLGFPHGISVAAGGAVALTDHVCDGVRVFVSDARRTIL